MAINTLPDFTPEQQAELEFFGLKPPQYVIWKNEARFRVAVCGRRFGKTHLSIAEALRACQVGEKRNILIVSPSIKQTRMLFWRQLLEALGEQDLIAEKNSTLLEIKLKGWGSTIKLGGGDNGDGLRGLSCDFMVLDEFALIPGDIWYEVLRPMLSDKMGEALFISTPRGMANWAYDLFLQAENDDNMAAFSFTTIQGGNVPPEEIEAARAQMSEEQFRQEYEAAFGSKSQLVYPNFDRQTHITKEAEDDGKSPIVLGIDPGVSPYVGILGQMNKDTNTLDVFEVIDLYGGHTQMFCKEMERRFHGRSLYAFPDPAARQRRSSSGGVTDYYLLAEAGMKVYAPSKIAVKDRVNCVNRALTDANGLSRIRVHPRCVALIKALEMQGYDDNGKPMKGRDAAGADHFTDAFGYLVWSKLPINDKKIRFGKIKGY